MIRIPILTKSEVEQLPNTSAIRKAEKVKLEELITATKANWLQLAKEKTEQFASDKAYTEPEGKQNWSDIKQVYMDLQANKCAYCEQKLEDKAIVHDVEHFRPKKNVKAWLTAKRKKEIPNLNFADSKGEGYYLLPYNIFNYATACKHCNSVLKSDYFPVAGQRRIDSDDFNVINQHEKPFLPYPIGHIDENSPEDLISFIGTSPTINPHLADNHQKLRAVVTIEFFKLKAERESLIKQRSKVIKDIFEAVFIINSTNDADLIKTKKDDLELWTSEKNEHTNCARSFMKLCMSDMNLAKEHYKVADAYIKTHPNK
jgi:hypothetical protein